jgi:hypothetical protein
MNASACKPIDGQKKCPQCIRVKPWPAAFIGRRGKPIGWCQGCQAIYSRWTSKSITERLARPLRRMPVLKKLRARLYPGSKNQKLGGIPCSVTSRNTCPPSCSFYNRGCYAELHMQGYHWRQVGEHGEDWPAFIDAVAQLPEGQLWRHNVAGDLPGDGERIDARRLAELVMAADHTRAFTFTHAHRLRENLPLIRAANESGFVVNLSADSLDEADRLAALDVGPVAVVLPSTTTGRSTRTPAGRKVVVCPAQTEASLTCADCQLCAQPNRKAAIGFLAHGVARARVDNLIRLRKPAMAVAP